MTITTGDGLIAARGASIVLPIQRATIANAAAGQLFSTWRSTGPLPAQGAIPGAAAIPTRTTSGALATIGGAWTNPTAPAVTYVDRVALNSSIANRIVLFDRLVHMGGLNGTLTTSQTVNTPALPARAQSTTGEGLEWFLEWYTDTGGTGVNCTVTYTRADGTGGRTFVIALGATIRAGRLVPIVPTAGDVAIKSVESVQLSATTGAAGSFGITCGRRLPVSAGIVLANTAAPQQAGLLERIQDDACLWPVVECSTTSTGQITGEITMVQG
jgi:hypothetical protein